MSEKVIEELKNLILTDEMLENLKKAKSEQVSLKEIAKMISFVTGTSSEEVKDCCKQSYVAGFISGLEVYRVITEGFIKNGQVLVKKVTNGQGKQTHVREH